MYRLLAEAGARHHHQLVDAIRIDDEVLGAYAASLVTVT